MDRSSDSDRMRGGDDRGFFDRAEDEVRSWFGGDSAERHRDRDPVRDDSRDRSDDRSGYRGDDRSGTSGSHYRDYDGPDADRYRRNYDVGNDADRRAREGYSSGRFFYETAGLNSRPSGPHDSGGSMRSSSQEYRGEDRDSGRSGGMGDASRMGGNSRSGASRYGTEGYGREDRDLYGSGMGPGMGGTSHAGRGPSGYSRSADRITEDVNEALMDDHDVDATHVQVSVDGGEVTLEGTVASRSEKRRAEDVAERCRGVRDVHNRLRVAEPGSTSSSGTAPGGHVSEDMPSGGSGPTESGAAASGTSGNGGA